MKRLSRSFDLRTVKSFGQAERLKSMLENKGFSVETKAVGLNAVRITGTAKVTTDPKRSPEYLSQLRDAVETGTV